MVRLQHIKNWCLFLKLKGQNLPQHSVTRLQKELMNLMSTSQDIEVTEVKYNEIPKQT